MTKAYTQTVSNRIRKEWGAIEGTYKALQERTEDSRVIALVDTIILHAKELGYLECALRNEVSDIKRYQVTDRKETK